MQRLLPLLLTLATASAATAQTPSAPEAHTEPAETHAEAHESHPIELSLGYNYAFDDQGSGNFTNDNGWYGTLNWARFGRVGLTLTHESYWANYRRISFNQHVYLAGITVKLRHGEPRVSPFIQPFGGTTRVSYAGLIEYQPTFELVAGADIRLHGRLSFEVLPAQYAYAHSATDGSLHNYQAGAGLEYTFGGHHEDAPEH